MAECHAGAIDRVALEVLRLTGLRDDDQPAPDPVRTFNAAEWKTIEQQLKAVANASSRRADNADNSED